jgi:hypothetical protein
VNSVCRSDAFDVLVSISTEALLFLDWWFSFLTGTSVANAAGQRFLDRQLGPYGIIPYTVASLSPHCRPPNKGQERKDKRFVFIVVLVVVCGCSVAKVAIFWR